MATTIVSNLTVFSDQTGTGNQSHLIYATNQGRWWLFNLNTKTATTVKCYVSSSNDLSTATWSAGTDSPAFPSSRALGGSQQRCLAVCGFANGSTDVVHVTVHIHSATDSWNEHIRATFTGASTISWESWTEAHPANTDTSEFQGNSVLNASDGFIHELQVDNPKGDPVAKLSTNADTGATWTNGYGSQTTIENLSGKNRITSALASLGSGAMLAVYGASTTLPTANDILHTKYASGTTWPLNNPGTSVGAGTSDQDSLDWCLCAVDTTHIYVFRRSGSNTFIWRVYDGSNWSTPANGVPNQNHQAASGMFAASDGTDLYLFVLDSASNQPVQYCKASNANGASPSWGSWTQLEGAGSTARSAISGFPVVGNHQIGVIFTAVNGSNFDIVVTALTGVGAPVASFTFTPSVGVAQLSVSFTDTSTQTPTSWLWEKNDGSGWVNFASGATSQNPTEKFGVGLWDVRLTATNAAGSNTVTQNDIIQANVFSGWQTILMAHGIRAR